MKIEDYILDELERQEASASIEEESVDGAINDSV